MWEDVSSVWSGMQSSLSWTEVLIALAFSLLFSLVIFAIYHVFYGSRHIGAGVNRMFLVGGPAITVLFLAIQTSIPLSLGLLGALSFVRFRTPVKDPAEIGFLLLLIASSIGAATGNFVATGVLLAAAVLILGVMWLVRRRSSAGSRGGLMISLDQAEFARVESDVKDYLASQLGQLKLESMSVVDGKVNLQYQCRKRSTFDWTAFTNGLNERVAPAKPDIFIG